ncbi:MAG TPA: hypothetical protein VLN49_09820, partial [Gemmatimonadaceae bacterium]|nr:hypothetical protein [Gemmatimonadaceae bacterium]
MRQLSVNRFALVCAIPLLLSVPALAQQNGRPSPAGSSTRSDPGAKKVLGLADIGRWKRINNADLSPDGAWMTYVYAPNDGDDTLFVRQLSGSTVHTIPGGSAPQFSGDSRFVGYFVSPPEGRGGRTGRGGAGGGRGRGGQAEGATPAGPSRRFELLDLSTGAKYQVPDGATFKFSKGSRFVAVRTNK